MGWGASQLELSHFAAQGRYISFRRQIFRQLANVIQTQRDTDDRGSAPTKCLAIGGKQFVFPLLVMVL